MFEKIKTNNLGYKDLFNFGFEIFCKNIKAIIPLVILVYLPVILIQLFAISDELSSQSNYIYEASFLVIAGKMSIESFMSLDLSPLFIVSIFTMVEVVVFTPLLSGGLTSLIKATVENEKGGSVEDMLQGSLYIIFKLMLTSLASLLAISLGTVLFILPGIFLAMAFTFRYQAVVMTGKYGLNAAKESMRVMAGKWLNVLGLLILVMLFVYAYSTVSAAVLVLIYNFIPYILVVDIIIELVFSVFLAYFQLVLCLWYVNRYYVVK